MGAVDLTTIFKTILWLRFWNPKDSAHLAGVNLICSSRDDLSVCFLLVLESVA